MSNKSQFSAIPAARSSRRQLDTRVWIVVGLLVLAALAGVLSTFAWMSADRSPAAVPPPQAQATGFATAAAYAWVNGDPVTTPTASGMGSSFGGTGTPYAAVGNGPLWDGFDVTTQLGRTTEIHRFLLDGAPPRVLRVIVQLTDTGPVLVAAPSVQPVLFPGEPPTAYNYVDADDIRVDLTADLSRVVQEWATAFAADDRQRLRDLSGDLEARTYFGLGQMTASDTQIVAVVGTGERYVARVITRLTGEGGFSGFAEYDLLIEQPKTATPLIVAWGSAGSGGFLAPYQNATTG